MASHRSQPNLLEGVARLHVSRSCSQRLQIRFSPHFVRFALLTAHRYTSFHVSRHQSFVEKILSVRSFSLAPCNARNTDRHPSPLFGCDSRLDDYIYCSWVDSFRGI